MTNSPTTKSPRTFLNYVFSPKHAQKAIKFIETYCFLFEGSEAGKPIKLRPWQRTMISELFGWIDPDTGHRRYRKAFWFLPKKNGKSSLIAGIALYMLIADGEKGGQVILASNSREQSMNVFRPAMGMVEQSPALQDECEIVKSAKRILHPESKSFLAVIPAEAKTIQGLSISCLIYDEIADAPDRDLYDKLTTASKTRLNPLQIFITTAGKDVNGIGYELYKYAKTILAQPEADPTFYPVIYELGKDEDWTVEENWFKCNPALGDFNQLADQRAEFREAMSSTSAQAKFKMYSLNMWVQAADSWLDVEKWNEQTKPLDESVLKDCACYIGLDLSSNIDLTAVAPLWVLPDGSYYTKPFLFLPEEGIRARVIRDHVPYDAWAEDENVFLTPGATVDYSFIRQRIRDLADTNTVKAIGYDPWQAHKLIEDLTSDGLTCIKIRQGHESLAAPTKEFESLIVGKKIFHNGNPCLSWQVSNVTVRIDANSNMVPDKKKSNHRIDGVMAIIMALACALRMATADVPKKPAELRITILG